MHLKNVYRNLRLSLSFRPKKRRTDKTSLYIKKIIETGGLNDKFYKNFKQSKTIKSNHKLLIRTTLSTFTEDLEISKLNKSISRITENPLAKSSDSINTPKVKKLVKLGIHEMQKTNDPFHDAGHIIRALQYGKILFKIYRDEYNLDWGKLALAIIWHDISRVQTSVFFYGKKRLKYLEKAPFLLDLSIIKNGLDDAKRSGVIFEKIAKENKLKNSIIRNVVQAIEGTKPLDFQSNKKQKADIYFKLVSDVDLIDLYSVGKFESAMRHITQNKMTSVKFFNRCIAIAAMLMSTHRTKHLSFPESKEMFDFSVYNLYKFGQKCYPEDIRILIEDFVKTSLIPSYS